VSDRLAGLGRRLEALPSRAPFLLLRLRGLTAAGLAGRLRKHEIIVRDGSNFVGLDDRYVRVGLRSAPDNDRLVRALVRCLGPDGPGDNAEDEVQEWPAH
jgi:threonine-phosphate decarboxylase